MDKRYLVEIELKGKFVIDIPSYVKEDEESLDDYLGRQLILCENAEDEEYDFCFNSIKVVDDEYMLRKW